MNLRKNNILIWVLCSLITSNILAQTRNNTPYSLYGIGTINDYSNPISFAMGGVGIAYQDYASINPLNPASFGSFIEKSFMFDVGLVMNSSTFTSVGIKEQGSYASLNHLLFGYQLMKKWKVSFGMVPFSDVGYQINMIENNDDIGEILQVYKGKGGLTKAYGANAFNITKNFSIGIETGIIFGKIEKNQLTYIPTSPYVFYNEVIQLNKYKDFYFKYGLQYNININENYKVVLGAIHFVQVAIKTDSSKIIQLVEPPVHGFPKLISIVDEKHNPNGKTKIPSLWGFGIMFSKKDHWKIGFDFKTQLWSRVLDDNFENSFKNSISLATGFEYIPDFNSMLSYLKRIKYRLGFRYEKTPLYLYETQLTEIGMSFGIGLPLRRSLSTVNLGLEIGQNGKMTDTLVKDVFIKFKFGVALFDRWFEKRKYY